MLRLSGFCKSKDLLSVRYGSMGCDDSNECYFWGPDNEWYVWVPEYELSIWVTDIDWRSLGSTLYSP